MDEFFAQTQQEEISGIRAEHWLSFFKVFREQSGAACISAEIEKLRQRVESSGALPSRIDTALAVLRGIEALIEST